MRQLGLVLVLVTGCTRALPINNDDGGGGACSSYQDTASCNADPRCVAYGCPGCNGQTGFAGCYDKGNPTPGPSCPAIACASCHALVDAASCQAAAGRGCITSTCCGAFTGCLDPGEQHACTADCINVCAGLDEKSCGAHSGCRADHCPACSPGSTYFAGCSDASVPPATCQPLPCPPPLPCDQVGTVDGCDARSDCHAVYQPGACGCAGCCCTFFARCASGAKANCTGPAFCNSAPPNCGDPACHGAYAVAYANNCYEGCVLATECGP